jgi:hypothetical protein
VALNERLSVPMFDNVWYQGATKHGIMGEFLPDYLVPGKAKQMWWKQQGLEPGSPIVARDYWTKGIWGWESGKRVSPLQKYEGANVVVRKTDPNIFSVNSPVFDAQQVREIAGWADGFGGRVFATTVPSLVNK